jgi:hypothetical protein
MCRCLTLTHSMPWLRHSVQNRDTARNVWMATLHVSNRAWRALQRRLYVKDMAEKAPAELRPRQVKQSGSKYNSALSALLSPMRGGEDRRLGEHMAATRQRAEQ